MSDALGRYAALDRYTLGVVEEREQYYTRLLAKSALSMGDCRFLEIGAGHGFNVHYFLEKGVKEENCTLIEPDSDRFESLKKTLPKAVIEEARFGDSRVEGGFDVILISLVLSSILDHEIQEQVLSRALTMLEPQGHLIIYEFRYDNPKNKNVKGVSPNLIKRVLKGGHKFQQWSVSLAPPIGRRVGKAYKPINYLFPFLRTHFIMDVSNDNS